MENDSEKWLRNMLSGPMDEPVTAKIMQQPIQDLKQHLTTPIPLGGEGRYVQPEVLDHAVVWPSARAAADGTEQATDGTQPTAADDDKACWLLTTPGVFEQSRDREPWLQGPDGGEEEKTVSVTLAQVRPRKCDGAASRPPSCRSSMRLRVAAWPR